MAKYQEKYFRNSDGLKQFYRDYGSPFIGAEIMLCMPGLTRNSRDFAYTADQLSDRFRVICVEQRGRGKSDYDPKPERYIPPTYVQDMFALMAHLAVDHVHACGTSLGGLVTFMMAASNPGSIKSAIINDIGPEIDPAGIERIKGYVVNTAPVLTWDDAIARTKFIADGVYPDWSEDDWVDFAHKIWIEKDGKPTLDYDPALSDTFKAPEAQDNAAPDLWPFFTLLHDVPMMVIRGETSDILSQATLDRMCADHPDCQPVLVPRVGHAPTLEEPEVVSAVEAWAARFSTAA